MMLIIANVLFIIVLLALVSAVIIGAVAVIGSLAGLTVNFLLIGMFLGGISALIVLCYILATVYARRRVKKFEESITDTFGEEFSDIFKALK